MQHLAGPVEGAGVTGDAPQAGHAAIVDRQEFAAALGDAAVADRRIVKAIFVDSLAAGAAADVEQDAEHFVRRRIAVVEEELRLLSLRIPVEHRPLLRIPGPRLSDGAGGEVVFGVEQDDFGRLAGVGQMIADIRSKRDDVAAALVPGNVLNVADVAEEMVQRAGGELTNFEPRRRSGGRMSDKRQQHGGNDRQSSHELHRFPWEALKVLNFFPSSAT